MLGSDPPSSIDSDDSHTPEPFPERFTVQFESRPPSPVHIDTPINPVFEKRTLRNVDKRLLPVLALLYASAFIDATNLSMARRAGADRDFNLLVGHRYYIVSFVFYVPYILLQLPFNLALRRIGPATWLGTVAFLLGVVQLSLAFVSEWSQLLGVRAILGFLEAAILPSCIYIISCWYTRHELHKRVALFYSVSVFVSSFTDILALGLSKIRSGGLNGWRWIFAIEGIVTVLISFYGYYGLFSLLSGLELVAKILHTLKQSCHYRPRNAFEKIFSEDEIGLVRQRIELDRGDYMPDALDETKLHMYLADLKLWAYGFLMLSATIGTDFSTADSQLLFIPAGIVATVLVILTGFLSDRLRMRGPFIVFHFILTTIGMCMIGFSGRRGVRFVGCIFEYGGAQANVSTILTYQANNVRLHSKRVVTISVVASLGGVGGLLSVLAFPRSAAPDYTIGLWLTLALQIAGVLTAGSLMVWLRWENEGVLPAAEGLGRDRDAGEERETRPGTPGPSRGRQVERRREERGEGMNEGLEGFQYMI
ncbi:hypothetical protein M0805_008907 [Coniferiporia weirii]|nr:hypothetical protein M0805_008907 [Coniferiporia weirii]